MLAILKTIGRELAAKDGESDNDALAHASDEDGEADALADADAEECAHMVRGYHKSKKMRKR